MSAENTPSAASSESTTEAVQPAPAREVPVARQRSRRSKVVEHALEWVLFESRWLLAPIYLGLIAALIVILIKFAEELVHLVTHIFEETPDDVVLGVLSLLDLALLSNLVLIVILAGYENFVSKIAAARDVEDRPNWMGHIDFSGLKMKLIGSIVAISAIGLLKDFTDLGTSDALDNTALTWRVVLHVTFLLSGIAFAFSDWLGEKRLMLSQLTHSND
ncbi:MAG: TIGR00645 family protein [Mycetocola sp.]